MSKQTEQIEAWTRQAVPEVFLGMLSMELSADAPAPLPLDAAGQIIGSVGFTGEATGIIYLYAGVTFAKVITGRMLGIEEAEVDPGDMVNDAIGELSNMVVGFVKSRLCDAGSACTLTIPSVVRGQQLSVEGSSQVSRRVVGFRSGQHQLVAEVLVKES
ncbi:MAG TPA: chemotaxis protein CheX [Verrucomicrobiae bacterium]|jgi:chemotaxis protein CheX|nr:chemotaxis protein CheX [Verrucomicrobiae bacterium]